MKGSLKKELLEELKTLGSKNTKLIRELEVELNYADIDIPLCREDIEGYCAESHEDIEEVANEIADKLMFDGTLANLVLEACERVGLKPLEEE